jgi:hypothetical protein
LGGAVVPRGDGTTVIRLRRGSSIQDFADKIDANAGQLITVLFHLGQMATATASLDEETFQILGEELGYKLEVVSAEDEERELFDSFGLDISTEFEEDEDDMEYRAPVVTVTVRLVCLTRFVTLTSKVVKPVVLLSTSVLTRFTASTKVSIEQLLSSIHQVTKRSLLCVLVVLR